MWQTYNTNECVQTELVTVVLMGTVNRNGTLYIHYTQTQSYTYTDTCVIHPHMYTHIHTHIVTESTRTAPRRAPLQLPPLYYWSIWRLLSQGWHGLGDVTAQPINTTLKAQDPQPACGCARMCACVYVCVSCWKLQQLWLDSTLLTCLPDSNYMGRDVHPAPADQLD